MCTRCTSRPATVCTPLPVLYPASRPAGHGWWHRARCGRGSATAGGAAAAQRTASTTHPGRAPGPHVPQGGRELRAPINVPAASSCTPARRCLVLVLHPASPAPFHSLPHLLGTPKPCGAGVQLHARPAVAAGAPRAGAPHAHLARHDRGLHPAGCAPCRLGRWHQCLLPRLPADAVPARPTCCQCSAVVHRSASTFPPAQAACT